KTKEIAFTLPIIIVLYEFMFFDGKIKKRILYLIPLLLTILIIPLAYMESGKSTGDLISDLSETARLQTEMSRMDYLFTQCRVIVTYIRLLFLPVNQNLDYDYPVYHSFLNPNVFLSFLFLMVIFCIGVYLLYRSRITHYLSVCNAQAVTLRITAFGILWFFVTLSVESSVIPIVDVIFEHRVYLPSIGAIIATTTFMFVLSIKIKDKLHHSNKIIISTLSLKLLSQSFH
ncbi:MAG: hypothetical protein HY806_06030, partial [Nitrospirae bacterium]|nr:hypothetical protein [Nitrospirota bacterium]